MNINENAVGALRDLFGADYVAEIMKTQLEAQKEKDEKFRNIFSIDVDGKNIEVSLKKSVTPELRHKLRGIVKQYPKDELKSCIEEFRRQEIADKTENELRRQFVAYFPQYTAEDINSYYSGNYINEEFEYNLDTWYLAYFQAILSMDGNSRRFIDTPVINDGKIYDFWNTIDMVTVRDAVGWFRSKMGI